MENLKLQWMSGFCPHFLWRIHHPSMRAAIYGVAQSRTRLKRLSSSSSMILICLGEKSALSFF